MAEGGEDIIDDVFNPADDMEQPIQHGSLRSELMKTKIRSFYESLSQEPPVVLLSLIHI